MTEDMMANDTDIHARYQRNISALSAEDMHTLHAAKVCIIGGGGLGGYITEILARIGIHHITLVDDDHFDTNNLNRQLFCEEALIGTPKVDGAYTRIGKVNSHVTLTPVKERFTPQNGPQILKGHHIVMDALDNTQSRLALAAACRTVGIPLVHGSIAGWLGQVAVIFPEENTMETLYGHVSTPRGIEKGLGNLPFTASMVASLQCAECIKVLTGKATQKGSILQIDLQHGSFSRFRI